jgi:hypothetical protein
VESLRAVVELKNQELHDARVTNATMKKQVL